MYEEFFSLKFFLLRIFFRTEKFLSGVSLTVNFLWYILSRNKNENLMKKLSEHLGVFFMKRVLIFLGAIIVAVLIFIAHLFQEDAADVPILEYFRVNDIDENAWTLKVEQFDSQIKYLVDEGYTIITVDELLDAWAGKGELPEKPVVLTFDDGNVDSYNNVLPILKKYNAKATLFIVTDHVNLFPSYITWDQAREMQSGGLVDIESHTLSHKNFTKIYSRDKLWDQIYGSKQAIEWYLKKPVEYIAYPEGKYTVEAEEICKEVGYRAGFTMNYGLAKNEPNNYVLDRIPVLGSNSHTFLRFKLRLKAAPIFVRLSRFKERLIEDGNPEIAEWIPVP